jgi:hypothetical protein
MMAELRVLIIINFWIKHPSIACGSPQYLPLNGRRSTKAGGEYA